MNELAYMAKRHHIEIPVPIEELSKLNPYAVIFRYDDTEIETIDRKEAENLIVTIRKWAKVNLKVHLKNKK